MPKSKPHAMSTLNRVMTNAQPPNWPNKFNNTKVVARNCKEISDRWVNISYQVLVCSSTHFATAPAHVHVVFLLIPLEPHAKSIFEECCYQTESSYRWQHMFTLPNHLRCTETNRKKNARKSKFEFANVSVHPVPPVWWLTHDSIFILHSFIVWSHFDGRFK